MRLKILSVSMLFLLVSLIVIAVIPRSSDAATLDPYEVPPGAPRWFPLHDFDEKGDLLELTVVYKKTSNGTFQERPIDVLIIESAKAKRNPTKEIAMDDAIFIDEKVESRVEETIENPRNSEMSILFYNEQQEGDLDNWDNATVKIRVDYNVINVENDETNVFLIILFIFLIILIIGAVIFLAYFLLKRRIKDSRTFFNPEEALYYVFRDIDGSIFYFTADQYSDMYNSNSLVTYDYIGQAMKKGGPVMTPVDEQGIDDLISDPMMAQPIMATPVVAQPISSPAESPPYQDPYAPSDDGQLQQDLYGDQGQMMEEPISDQDPDALKGSEDALQDEPQNDVLDELVATAHSHAEAPIDEPLANIEGENAEEPVSEQ